LVLFNDSIKFQIKNFDTASIKCYEQNWDDISQAIISAFTLVEKWGFNDSSLRAKNAMIPIIYFIYYNGLQNQINKKDAKLDVEKTKIKQWLCISLLKGSFGGQSDSVLSRIRRVLKSHQGDCTFPLSEIIDVFKDDPSKNLSFTDDFVDELLKTQMGKTGSGIILSLLYSHLMLDNPPHQDHIHPYIYFEKLKQGTMSDEDFAFYKDKENYNSILNLQLLPGSENSSKNDKPLADWVKEKNINLKEQLIPENVSLDVSDFRRFIEERKKILKERLFEIVGQR